MTKRVAFDNKNIIVADATTSVSRMMFTVDDADFFFFIRVINPTIIHDFISLGYTLH